MGKIARIIASIASQEWFEFSERPHRENQNFNF